MVRKLPDAKNYIDISSACEIWFGSYVWLKGFVRTNGTYKCARKRTCARPRFHSFPSVWLKSDSNNTGGATIASEVAVAEIIAAIRDGFAAFDASVLAAEVPPLEIIFLLLKFTSPSPKVQLETQNRSNIRVIEFPAGFLPSWSLPQRYCYSGGISARVSHR